MKIENNSHTFFEPYAASAAADKTTQPRTTDAAALRTEGGDTVSVSQDALLLTEVQRTARNAPDVRADKVAALRQAVTDGTYVVDSRRIARSLIRDEPGLFRL